MARVQTDYYKLVGEVDGEYYFLDYIFEDGDFKGATATVVRPVHKEEYEEQTSQEAQEDYAREFWQQAVAEGKTDDGLSDWMDYNGWDETIMFDSDMKYEIEQQMRELFPSEDETPVLEVTGGGRSFRKNMKFDKVYNQDLLDKINEVEND